MRWANRLARRAKTLECTLETISAGETGRTRLVADVTKLLLMAEELLIVSWSQVNEEERAQLSAALEIVKEIRTNRAALESEQTGN